MSLAESNAIGRVAWWSGRCLDIIQPIHCLCLWASFLLPAPVTNTKLHHQTSISHGSPPLSSQPGLGHVAGAGHVTALEHFVLEHGVCTKYWSTGDGVLNRRCIERLGRTPARPRLDKVRPLRVDPKLHVGLLERKKERKRRVAGQKSMEGR